MKERMKEFKKELKEVDESEFSFIQLTKWFQEWAVYIAKGGDRPGRPHG